MICNTDSNRFLAFGSFSMTWSLVTIWWLINNRYINNHYTKPIHFILSFALVFKTSEIIFQFLVSYSCDDSAYLRYYELGYSSAYTLYSTFLYTILLLMSKGLSLTRDYLERNEISLIALIMGVIYLSFSAYTIDPTNLQPLRIVILSILWYSIHNNSIKVIFVLLQRYNMLRANNLNRTIEATKTKINMMKNFKRLTNLLFFSQITNVIGKISLIILYKGEYTSWDFFLTVFNEFLQIVAVFGICVVFMPRYRGSFFEMADFESGGELREVTPMYDVEIPSGNQEIFNDKPFILINPSESPLDSFSPYKNLMIALPMTQSFRRQSVDDLHQLLLPEQLDR